MVITDASLSEGTLTHAPRPEPPRSSYIVRSILVFALYFAVGKLGLSVPFTSGNVSPIWPAYGVALSAVLLWGYEIGPAIALAAFLLNFLSSIPAVSAFGM